MNIQNFYKNYFRPGIVSTDSRKINRGTIFIALKGENFNGNDFAASAIEAGAEVAVVDENVKVPSGKIIRVANTLRFIQELATFHRRTKKYKIIGLTGSNGKTTTRELIHAVLSLKFRVQSTQGNLNNHIGVPLTLLSIKNDTEIGVVEMGANHPGEIETLCDISQPDSGLITNIGRAHLEGFDGFEGVIKTKSELYHHLKSNNGTIFYNGSDTLLTGLVNDYANKVCYGTKDGICYGEIIKSVPTLTIKLTISGHKTEFVITNIYGDYNLFNILAAAAIGLDQGMNIEEVKKGVEGYHPENLRSQVLKIGSSTVIMDCYNANPTSMALALTNMTKFGPENKIAILGGMKELGKESAREHRKIVRIAEGLHLEKIIFFGPEFSDMKLENSYHTESYVELSAYIKSLDLKNRIILVKGSRSNKLERLEEVFRDYYLSVK